jgi:hypothetical protein
MEIVQEHVYDIKSESMYWRVYFTQISLIPLTNEEHHEVSAKLDQILEDLENRRKFMGTGN